MLLSHPLPKTLAVDLAVADISKALRASLLCKRVHIQETHNLVRSFFQCLQFLVAVLSLES